MQKLIAANWKMHPVSAKSAEQILKETVRRVRFSTRVKTILCPPYPYLPLAARFTKGKRNVACGAQDVFWETEGAFTGEVSGAMIRDIGASHVIVGHSERRTHFSETDEMVQKKLKSALAARLRPILCVGERKRDSDGLYFRFIKNEILTALKGLGRKQISSVVIAYEPIWAISNISGGRAVAPKDALEMALFIEKIISALSSRKIAARMSILYGGSVNPENAAAFLAQGRVNGFLVGAESLKPSHFASIVKAGNETTA